MTSPMNSNTTMDQNSGAARNCMKDWYGGGGGDAGGSHATAAVSGLGSSPAAAHSLHSGLNAAGSAAGDLSAAHQQQKQVPPPASSALPPNQIQVNIKMYFFKKSNFMAFLC